MYIVSIPQVHLLQLTHMLPIHIQTGVEVSGGVTPSSALANSRILGTTLFHLLVKSVSQCLSITLLNSRRSYRNIITYKQRASELCHCSCQLRFEIRIYLYLCGRMSTFMRMPKKVLPLATNYKLTVLYCSSS